MIKRLPNIQVITDRFGSPRHYGSHRGVDLRSVRFLKGTGYVKQWALQQVITPESCIVDRFGTDNSGNKFVVVRPFETNFTELKFIHVNFKELQEEQVLIKHEFIGYTEIGGTSKAHHLHFEVWKRNIAIDPVVYFIAMNIKYKFK